MSCDGRVCVHRIPSVAAEKGTKGGSEDSMESISFSTQLRIAAWKNVAMNRAERKEIDHLGATDLI